MKTQRQTVIVTRRDTGLAADVSGTLPTLAAQARASNIERPLKGLTFCPDCGGNKLPKSLRCHLCRDRLQHMQNAIARRLGYRSFGRQRAARHLGPQLREVPPRTEPPPAQRARGVGQQRTAPASKRHRLVDGVWVAEDWDA